MGDATEVRVALAQPGRSMQPDVERTPRRVTWALEGETVTLLLDDGWG